MLLLYVNKGVVSLLSLLTQLLVIFLRVISLLNQLCRKKLIALIHTRNQLRIVVADCFPISASEDMAEQHRLDLLDLFRAYFNLFDINFIQYIAAFRTRSAGGECLDDEKLRRIEEKEEEDQ